jgi:prepilin-type N-terminal cleavage/methylation domain-containing protein|tara:strand:+ start:11570 stop:11902 length:333 start_codon:yes stop_codon:yes gene_type:complete
LKYKFKRGFSLLEVVISLLIISITFLAYSQLIEQNLKSQELKKSFINDSNNRLNLLTIYTSEPQIDKSEITEVLDITNISETVVTKYQKFDEIRVDVTVNNQSIFITVIK